VALIKGEVFEHLQETEVLGAEKRRSGGEFEADKTKPSGEAQTGRNKQLPFLRASG
jgi:hypothetical protein